MRIAGGILATLVSATPCRADDVQDKVCLVAAIRQLPQIQGLTLTESINTPIASKTDAVANLLALGDIATTIEQASAHGWIDDAITQAAKRAVEVDRKAVVNALQPQLVDRVAGGIMIEITGVLAGTKIVFGAICLWDATGGTIAQTAGIVR